MLKRIKEKGFIDYIEKKSRTIRIIKWCMEIYIMN
jgi:hypothetical protein